MPHTRNLNSAMYSLPPSARVLLLLAGIVIWTSGCSSRGDLRLQSGDINAWKRINDASPWQFRQSLLDIQVREAGGVEISLEGEAKQKEWVNSSTMLLPVALVRELPDYLKGTDQSSKTAVELQAYKVAGGLWCIIALVPLGTSPDLVQSQQHVQPTPPDPRQIHLKVLLISPEFNTRLPLIIPIGERRAGADLFVTLPPGARFTSLNVSGDRQPSEEGAKLVLLPPSLTGGAVRAAAKLSPESAAWNFSQVTYARSSILGIPKEYLLAQLIVASLAILSSFYYGLKVIGLRKKRKAALNSKLQLAEDAYAFFHQIAEKVASISALEIELHPHAMTIEGEFHGEYHDLINKRGEIYKMLEELKTATYKGFDPALIKSFDDVAAKFSHLLNEIAHATKLGKKPQGMNRFIPWLQKHQELADIIHLFTHRLKHVNQIEELKNQIHRAPQERWLLLFIFYTIILVLIMSSYVMVARGQENQPPALHEPQGKVMALGDFGMAASPKDVQSDKVGVVLDFIALTSSSSQGTGEIGIGTGDGNNAEMEEVKVSPSETVKITQQSRKMARLSVPSSNIPALSVLAALSDPQIQIEKVRITDSLQAALNDRGNLVRLEYVVTKAQENKNYMRWVHRFPFDYRSLTIPVKLQQPAIISKIELPRQSNEFTAVVSAKGIYDAEFTESDNAYRLDLGRRESRITIPAGGEVVIEATLRRTRWQQILLTVGQVVLAIIGGWFLGFIASLSSDSPIGTVIGGIGLIGLPYLMRSSVLSTYKDLPTLLSGQVPTIFELVFLFSLALFIYTAWKTWRKREKRAARNN